MDDLNFNYQGITPGHSLNKVITEPALIKQLRAHCTKNKCHPVEIHGAYYNFVMYRGKASTSYGVNIELSEGKSDESLLKWFKANPIQWVFGTPSEEMREIG